MNSNILNKSPFIGFQSSDRLPELVEDVEQLLDRELAAASVAADLGDIENQIGTVHEHGTAVFRANREWTKPRSSIVPYS